MPLEVATYVNQLVESNPLSSDDRSQGDDHIRLIKSVLKATFPNLNAAVTATPSVLNGLNSRVSTIENSFVKKDGSVTMTGGLNMGSNVISSLGNPQSNDHAVNLATLKAYTQALYPVGSLYFNAFSEDNPAILLGFGTWELYGSGRVLACMGETTDDRGESRELWLGRAEGRYQHVLTVDELPAHSHTYSRNNDATDYYDNDDADSPAVSRGTHQESTSVVGGDQPHENMPPYITVACWVRVA